MLTHQTCSWNLRWFGEKISQSRGHRCKMELEMPSFYSTQLQQVPLLFYAAAASTVLLQLRKTRLFGAWLRCTTTANPRPLYREEQHSVQRDSGTSPPVFLQTSSSPAPAQWLTDCRIGKSKKVWGTYLKSWPRTKVSTVSTFPHSLPPPQPLCYICSLHASLEIQINGHFLFFSL